MENNKIVAVVVTRNRIEQLKLTLDTLAAQTYKPSNIIVVDNQSSDGTQEFFSNSKAETVSYYRQGDCGSAGGFARGIEEALKSGADWVWLMDDDASPEPTALQKLVESWAFQDPSVGLLACLVKSQAGPTNTHWAIANSGYWIHSILPQRTIPLSAASYLGMMIRREAVETVGYPLKSFYLFVDDYEFSRRISSKFRCYGVLDSLIVHPNGQEIEKNLKVDIAEDSLKFWCLFRNNAVEALLCEGSLFRRIRVVVRRVIGYRYFIKTPRGLMIALVAIWDGVCTARHLSPFRLPIKKLPHEDSVFLPMPLRRAKRTKTDNR